MTTCAVVINQQGVIFVYVENWNSAQIMNQQIRKELNKPGIAIYY